MQTFVRVQTKTNKNQTTRLAFESWFSANVVIRASDTHTQRGGYLELTDSLRGPAVPSPGCVNAQHDVHNNDDDDNNYNNNDDNEDEEQLQTESRGLVPTGVPACTPQRLSVRRGGRPVYRLSPADPPTPHFPPWENVTAIMKVSLLIED